MKARDFLKRKSPEKICACGCEKPLGPRVDGERQKIDGKEVNDDCYFRIFGEVVERYPVQRMGRRS